MTNPETPIIKKPFPYQWVLIFAGLSIFSDLLKYGYKLAKNANFLYTDQLFYGILIAVVCLLLFIKIRSRIKKAQVEKILTMVDQAIYEESKAGQEEKASKRRTDA